MVDATFRLFFFSFLREVKYSAYAFVSLCFSYITTGNTTYQKNPFKIIMMIRTTAINFYWSEICAALYAYCL